MLHRDYEHLALTCCTCLKCLPAGAMRHASRSTIVVIDQVACHLDLCAMIVASNHLVRSTRESSMMHEHGVDISIWRLVRSLQMISLARYTLLVTGVQCRCAPQLRFNNSYPTDCGETNISTLHTYCYLLYFLSNYQTNPPSNTLRPSSCLPNKREPKVSS